MRRFNSKEKVMLKYNQEAKRLISTFKQYRNDIDIYTEDDNKDKEFYKVLFQRLLANSNITINDITPLGCRKNVIKRCKNEPNNGRRKIFIVDGDIYIIYKSDIEKIDNLFILDSYCIENYIIDEESCSQFAYSIMGTHSIEEIKQKIQFNDWINSFIHPLIDLFIHFSILDEVNGTFQIFNAYKYINKGNLDNTLVFKEIKLVTKEILQVVDFEKYEHLKAKREQLWAKTPETFFRIVSGKDYILPLVQVKLQTIRKVKGLYSNEAIKTFLAHFCNLDRLEPLKNAIINLN